MKKLLLFSFCLLLVSCVRLDERHDYAYQTPTLYEVFTDKASPDIDYTVSDECQKRQDAVELCKRDEQKQPPSTVVKKETTPETLAVADK